MKPVTERILALLTLQTAVWLVTVLVVVAAGNLFFELAEEVWLRAGFAWDAPLMLALHRLSTPWLDTAVRLVTLTGGKLLPVPLAAVLVWLWRSGQRFEAVTLLGSVAGAIGLNLVLKSLFARPRPAVFPPLVIETSYSFPSGHAMAATALYGLVALYLGWRGHVGWGLLMAVWPLLVAASRVYLGVHYPSDVLASLSLGTLWLAGVVAVYAWQRPREGNA